MTTASFTHSHDAASPRGERPDHCRCFGLGHEIPPTGLRHLARHLGDGRDVELLAAGRFDLTIVDAQTDELQTLWTHDDLLLERWLELAGADGSRILRLGSSLIALGPARGAVRVLRALSILDEPVACDLVLSHQFRPADALAGKAARRDVFSLIVAAGE